MTIQVDPNWWQTLFDEVYLTTDARSVGDADLTRLEIDLFCELLPLQPADRILDLCGGQGRHSLELSRRGYQGCVVVDYSGSLLCRGLDSARCHGTTVVFMQCDARWVPLADESCEHVLILGNSLGYLPDADADQAILAESRRLLKAGGWLLVDLTDGRQVRQHFAPNAWHEIGPDVVVCRQRELVDEKICAREMVLSKSGGMIRDRSYQMRLYAPADIRSLLTGAGFSAIRVRDAYRPHDQAGDYGFMNQRMLITARKMP